MLVVPLELDCVRPAHADECSPRWDNAKTLSSPGLVWPTPESSGSHPSLPSLVPVSGTSTGSSIWGSTSFGPDQFDRDVDEALDGVEEEFGGRLMGFPEVEIVVPVEGEEFDIRTQVAYRSAGPPWSSSGSSGGSSSSAIYLE